MGTPSSKASQTLLPDSPSDTACLQSPKSGNDLEQRIKKDIMDLNPETQRGILLLGPVRAGKSSFINSCLSVSKGRKTAIATTGCAKGSYTTELTSYTNRGILNNCKLVDCMGIEPEYQHGFLPDDIDYILQGHVKNGYPFDPEKHMTTDSKYYRENPKFEHKIHCIVFVIDATTIHNGQVEAYVKKIKYLEPRIKDIPRVLILTKVDLLSDKVRKDASYIFRCSKVKGAMIKVRNLLSVEDASIHPVINYEVDINVSTVKNIPILQALHQILKYACDGVRYVLNDSESDSSDEEDSR